MTRKAKILSAALAVGGGMAGIGCVHTDRPGLQNRYSNLVDTSWPERYASVARKEVLTPFAIQVNNGHIIDQTIYSYHFEPGSDKLTTGGREKLDVLDHRRPTPDPMIYLQVAQDQAYDPAHPEKFVADRNTLDAKRAQAILRYLNASTPDRPVNWQVQLIDAASITVPAEWRAGPYRGLQRQFTSGLAGQTGAQGQQAGPTGPNQGTGATGPTGSGGSPSPSGPSPSN